MEPKSIQKGIEKTIKKREASGRHKNRIERPCHAQAPGFRTPRESPLLRAGKPRLPRGFCPVSRRALLVLSCPDLSCPVLSCLVLSCPVLQSLVFLCLKRFLGTTNIVLLWLAGILWSDEQWVKKSPQKPPKKLQKRIEVHPKTGINGRSPSTVFGLGRQVRPRTPSKGPKRPPGRPKTLPRGP